MINVYWDCCCTAGFPSIEVAIAWALQFDDDDRYTIVEDEKLVAYVRNGEVLVIGNLYDLDSHISGFQGYGVLVGMSLCPDLGFEIFEFDLRGSNGVCETRFQLLSEIVLP